MDTPLRIVRAKLDHATTSLTRSPNSEDAYLEVLERFSRAVERERGKLRSTIRGIVLKLSGDVVDEGLYLSGNLGGKENFEKLSKNTELKVQKSCETAAMDFENAVKNAEKTLADEVEKVMNSHLMQAMVAKVYAPEAAVGAQEPEQNDSAKKLKKKVSKIADIGGKVGAKIASSAVEEGAETAGAGFIRAGQAAGSQIHKAVYEVGKFIGYKFRPWEAVRIAKNIGNVAKVVGPILSVITVAVDVYEEKQEADNERQLADARREINGNFMDMAKNLEEQFEKQLREIEADLYGAVEEDIAKARSEEEAHIANTNESVRELLAIRGRVDSMLDRVSAKA